MRIKRALAGALGLLLAACASSAHSSAGSEDGRSSCTLLREAAAQVDDVTAGVALNLRLSGSEFDVVTLQDYLGHVVHAWNEAEQGIVQRCFPRVAEGATSKVLASTAELTRSLDGARVVFTPAEPAHLLKLREHVRRQKARTLSCACSQSALPRPFSNAPAPRQL